MNNTEQYTETLAFLVKQDMTPAEALATFPVAMPTDEGCECPCTVDHAVWCPAY